MDYRKTFSKKTLDVMNYDRKYGSNWIKFENETPLNSLATLISLISVLISVSAI
jgi:hypothetical protein